MRVLVTGNLGYIGPVVVRRLMEAGHYVIGWDLGLFVQDYADLPMWPHKQRIVDIRDARMWSERVDAVVHLAGLSNDPMGDLDPGLTDDINFEGTLRVVGAHPQARHVVVSSCSVYGTNDMATEATRVHPLTAYARAKANVDAALPILSANGLSLRLGTVYGYSPGHRLDLVVNRMVYDAVNKGVVTATGNAARPLVHVEDVAKAIAYFLPREDTGIVNIVAENVRVHTLAKTVADFTDAELDIQPNDADQRDYMASPDKSVTLGFLPTRFVRNSLPLLIERTNELPPGRYTRLTTLRRHMDRGLDLARTQEIAA